jgi:peptidoglycan/LPS O-acetylase OafA/YrhL
VLTQKDAKTYFRRDIQGLRALAVILVVAYHASLSIPHVVDVSGGFIGVDMFFVISGFVVGGVLFREIDARNHIRVRRFFARRARRLLPALAVMLVVTLLFSFFLIPLDFADVVGWSALGAGLFAANFVLYDQVTDYFASTSGLNPLLHTWSLSVEEQFYFVLVVVFSLGLLLAKRMGSNPRTLLIGMTLLLFVLSFAYSVYEVTANEALAFFSPVSRAWEFLAGVLLFAGWARIERTSVVTTLAPLVHCSPVWDLLAMQQFSMTPRRCSPGQQRSLPVVGTVLLIVAGAGRETALWRRIFDNPLAVFHRQYFLRMVSLALASNRFCEISGS